MNQSQEPRAQLSPRALRWAIALLLALAMGVATLLALPAPRAEAAGCAQTYTVRHGDWLAEIARRHGLTFWQLVSLNSYQLGPDLDIIYPGQVLCVRVESAAGPRNSRVAVQFVYQYDPEAPAVKAQSWNLARDGLIAKRIVYPLAHTIDTVDTVSETKEVATWLTRKPPAVLFGVRNSSTANDYTLVGVGEKVFSSWFISDVVKAETLFEQSPAGGCPEPQPLTVMSVDAPAKAVTATVFLEGDEGIAYPFQITALDWAKDAARAQQCYGDNPDKLIAFALAPATSLSSKQYKIRIVLNDKEFGPPGVRWRRSCRSWYGGWFYRWMRSFFGC